MLIDFHAHILPKADHGCDSITTALQQICLAEAAGVGHILVTPHFYPDRRSASTFFERRTQAFSLLRESYSGSVQMHLGAEVFLCEGLQNHERLLELCIEGTHTLLLELPNAPWQKRDIDTIEAIQNSGIQVILAHIDRYPRENIKELLERLPRLLAQVNAGAWPGLLGSAHWRRLLDRDVIWALGSDIHGVDEKAYRRYEKTVKQLGKSGQLLQGRMAKLLHVPAEPTDKQESR